MNNEKDKSNHRSVSRSVSKKSDRNSRRPRDSKKRERSRSDEVFSSNER